MLPLVTVLACSVVSKGENEAGCQIVRIDTQTPWGIQTADGRTQFEVLPAQLCELPREAGER